MNIKKYIWVFLLLILSVCLNAQSNKVLEYLNYSNYNMYMMPKGKSNDEMAFDTPRKIIRKYNNLIRKISRRYHIEPQLLGSVIFVETYGGGISGWYELKNTISLTLLLLFGKATIGVTQVAPENVEDRDLVLSYKDNIIWQLSQGAIQLASIRDAIYPNAVKLSPERIANVLRFYNQGTKMELMSYDDEVRHYALAHYKKNLRIRKRIRLSGGKPYYSNEISVYNKEKDTVDIYVFNVLVAKYSIGGNKNKANTYAWTAYKNRNFINLLLFGKEKS